MKTNQMEEFDYLILERISILLKQGYFGFNVIRLTSDHKIDQFIVEASNDRGVVLSASGDTKEEACKKLIDLIDLTMDDL